MKVFSYSSDDLGVIAQLGERLNGIQEVRSSILLSSTNSKKTVLRGRFSSVTSWLPCREREAGATATRLGTQGEWFHSLDESRNYFEFNT